MITWLLSLYLYNHHTASARYHVKGLASISHPTEYFLSLNLICLSQCQTVTPLQSITAYYLQTSPVNVVTTTNNMVTDLLVLVCQHDDTCCPEIVILENLQRSHPGHLGGGRVAVVIATSANHNTSCMEFIWYRHWQYLSVILSLHVYIKSISNVGLYLSSTTTR